MFKTRFLYLATLACATVAAPLAFAGSSPQSPAKTTLPGVGGDYSIVKPLPPEPDEQENGISGTHFKIGNTEVRIRGSISVDISAGSLPPPRR